MRFLLAMIAFAAATQAAAPSFPTVGGAFPAFSLEDQAGVKVSNADLKGGYAVVEFVRSGDW